jgi:hypothetical protein
VRLKLSSSMPKWQVNSVQFVRLQSRPQGTKKPQIRLQNTFEGRAIPREKLQRILTQVFSEYWLKPHFAIAEKARNRGFRPWRPLRKK